ncbi:hypothetical protein ACJJI4_18300 [Microbulbifer sp. TRSA002]
MDDMNPIELALDICVFVYFFGLIYGALAKRLYFAGWHYYVDNKKKYWEVFFSYVLMIAGLIFIRYLLLSKISNLPS